MKQRRRGLNLVVVWKVSWGHRWWRYWRYTIHSPLRIHAMRKRKYHLKRLGWVISMTIVLIAIRPSPYGRIWSTICPCSHRRCAVIDGWGEASEPFSDFESWKQHHHHATPSANVWFVVYYWSTSAYGVGQDFAILAGVWKSRACRQEYGLRLNSTPVKTKWERGSHQCPCAHVWSVIVNLISFGFLRKAVPSYSMQ